VAVLKTWVVCGCFAAAHGDTRCRHPHLEQAGPHRQRGRERDHDSCPDPQEREGGTSNASESRRLRCQKGRSLSACRVPSRVRLRQQTHGKPLPEFAKTTGDPKDFADKLKAFVAKQGISLEYDKSIAPALGASSGGRIRLIPDMRSAEEFSVLAHELAHEMLHHRKDDARLPKVVVETQAEAVAYVVCRGVGLETNSAAADYIALYNGDKKTLAESLSVIQETSSKILDQLLPEQRMAPAHEKESQGAFTNKSAQSHDEPGRAGPPQSVPAAQMPDHSDSIYLDR
jgi:hypothetical protein